MALPLRQRHGADDSHAALTQATLRVGSEEVAEQLLGGRALGALTRQARLGVPIGPHQEQDAHRSGGREPQRRRHALLQRRTVHAKRGTPADVVFARWNRLHVQHHCDTNDDMSMLPEVYQLFPKSAKKTHGYQLFPKSAKKHGEGYGEEGMSLYGKASKWSAVHKKKKRCKKCYYSPQKLHL